MTENLAQKVVEMLKRQKLTLSCAESCTGGMLSAVITSISGASEVFPLGVVSYASEMKRDILKVPEETLNTFGTIAPDTAYYMAKGVSDTSNTNVGVGITGVAGPTKSEGKPVGLVYIGVYSKNRATVFELTESETKSRDEIRESAVKVALKLILKHLETYDVTTPKKPYELINDQRYTERG